MSCRVCGRRSPQIHLWPGPEETITMRAMISISFALTALSTTMLTAQAAPVVAPETRAIQIVPAIPAMHAVETIPVGPPIPVIPLYFGNEQETAASLYQQARQELNRR